jgi:hypothetical protein
MTHPGVTRAMILVLHRELGLTVQQASEASPRIIAHLERFRITVLPDALLKAPPDIDPFTMLGEMAEALEEQMGRKPWLPEM